MVKKAERLARATLRDARERRRAREDEAMAAFLEVCRAELPASISERHLAGAERFDASRYHVVEQMVVVLAARKHPIGAPLRKALDAMLEMLEIDRRNAPWPELRRLNYGAYWKSQYGYEDDADSGDVAP